MVGTRRLTALVSETLALLDLPDGALVVALSGGADSAALALMVREAGRSVRAVHVDHGFPASPQMREAAESVARLLGISLDVVEVVVPEGASPEGMAREARYRALGNAARPGETLLTAHTAEDNLETVIINLVRGSATRGLAGIPGRRIDGTHRPMLKVRRHATREIAVLAGMPFADDPMNLDPALARTHIRLRILPQLEALNPDLAATVTRGSALIRADADFLDDLANRVAIRVTPDGLAVAIGDLKAAPGVVAGRVVRSMLAALHAPRGAATVARVLAAGRGDTGPVEAGAGVVATRRGALLHLARSRASDDAVVPLTVGESRHAGLVFEVTRVEGVCRVVPLGRWRAIFAADAELTVGPEGEVMANGELAWVPGSRRLGVAWYRPGAVGYLSVLAREESGWTSSP